MSRATAKVQRLRCVAMAGGPACEQREGEQLVPLVAAQIRISSTQCGIDSLRGLQETSSRCFFDRQHGASRSLNSFNYIVLLFQLAQSNADWIWPTCRSRSSCLKQRPSRPVLPRRSCPQGFAFSFVKPTVAALFASR